MTYFIYGEDTFRVREDVAAIRQAAQQAGAAVMFLEGREVTADGLNDHISSGSLFATKSALFIRNLLAEGTIAAKEQAMTAVDRLPPDRTLIFWEEGRPDRRTRLFGLLAKKAKCIERSSLTPAEVARWVADRAKKKGVVIAADAAHLLAQFTGSDLARADTELEKLLLYRNGQSIDLVAVETLVAAVITPNIFSFLDEVLRDHKQAAVRAEQLLSAGEEPLYIFSMLIYQVRTLLSIKDVVERERLRHPTQVARRIGLHPYVAQKMMATSSRFSLHDLVILHRRLTELDVAIKTGGIDPSDALLVFAGRAN
jgi:DNA polymerase-3 subunit delta